MCTIEGCLGGVVARGWCNKHYIRWKTYGDPEGSAPPPKKITCSLPNCEEVHYGLGYCVRHWRAFKKHGEALSGTIQCRGCGGDIPGGKNAPRYCRDPCQPVISKPRKCSETGCDRDVRAKGLCKSHLNPPQKSDPPIKLPKSKPARRVLPCLWCGNQFLCTSGMVPKFCSQRCRNQEYWNRNRERLKVQCRAYRAANRDEINRQNREIRKANPEKYRALDRLRVRDRVKSSADYRDRNRAKINESIRRWAKNNPDKIKVSNHLRRSYKSKATTFKVLPKYLRRMRSRLTVCPYCLVTPDSGWHLDHVFPLVRGGRHSESNLLYVCASCNLSKQDKTAMEWKLWRIKAGEG